MSHTATNPHKNTARCLLLLLVVIITFLFLFRDPPKQESTMSPIAYDGESCLRSMLLENAVRKVLERRLWFSNKHYEGNFFFNSLRVTSCSICFCPPCHVSGPSRKIHHLLSCTMEASGCTVFTKSTQFDPFAAVGIVWYWQESL